MTSPATPSADPSPARPPGAAFAAEPSGWRRLVAAGRPRAGRAGLLGAVLALLLGFAVATQVQQTRAQDLVNLRQTDLVGILDNLNANADRLEAEARDLQSTRDRLVSGSAGEEAALRSAQERLDALGVLAGTVAVTGPGIVMTVTDPGDKVTSALLLDAIQELRDAGAESIQLGSVRVVASSYLSSDGRELRVDGVPIRSPYKLLAIGDAQTLASAMAIPGGIVETVRGQGATITVTTEDSLRIDALHVPRAPRYARPGPTATRQ